LIYILDVIKNTTMILKKFQKKKYSVSIECTVKVGYIFELLNKNYLQNVGVKTWMIYS
jgi:hypothetical protein